MSAIVLRWVKRRDMVTHCAVMGWTHLEVYPRSGTANEYNFRIYRRGVEIDWGYSCVSLDGAKRAAERRYAQFARREAKAMAEVLRKFGAK